MVKTVHTVHCRFLLFIFNVLAREYSVNSEHFTVHLRRLQVQALWSAVSEEQTLASLECRKLTKVNESFK
ncbi:hypothetical protein DD575_03640 [Klebsiella pneumoniae]|nr:hypothetical protein DD587_19095 [Klebsiella pneumoniae]RXY12681.1 hypothetical protein DD576_20840 [Klebsiella pneumoniae]RXY23050.1 hypothetical protein DD575_03640 [Klebsiella pneumoniae]